jgi:Spy/CpxP family protein refolding chaperone
MKFIKANWLIAMTVAGLVAGSSLALAQNSTGDTKPSSTQRAPRGDMLKRMTKTLDLTEKQQAELKTVFKETQDKMKELRAKTDLSREDRRAEMQKIRKASNEKIKKILTPEQWDKWQKEMQNARRQRTRQQQ